ncbi:MAG: NAD-dependent dehydratase [Pseudonocardia sp. SCN 72-86]|nr:MAG: NAD-dependent dehydratase [Pseudonocardia sp. SCN 72-86]
MERILITGAAGRVAGMLLEHLPRAGRELRLLDLVPIADADSVVADATDLDAMVQACQGIDAVVHLAGIAREDTWTAIRDVNIESTYIAFEAARRAGVPRVVFASSNHAVGFHANEPDLTDDLPMRPDTFYGVSKVVGEALGSLYHDRYGLDVVCLRIGTCFAEPFDRRRLATWLSPEDCARLVDAALTCPSPGFRTVWGVSANTRCQWSLRGGAAIGYHPQDDAEQFAARFAAAEDPELEAAGRRVGGRLTL